MECDNKTTNINVKHCDKSRTDNTDHFVEDT